MRATPPSSAHAYIEHVSGGHRVGAARVQRERGGGGVSQGGRRLVVLCHSGGNHSDSVAPICARWRGLSEYFEQFRFRRPAVSPGVGSRCQTSEAEKLVDRDQIQRERGASLEYRILADEVLPGILCRELATLVLLFKVDGAHAAVVVDELAVRR
eukprot:1304808-Prymnesium_polylepis.1